MIPLAFEHSNNGHQRKEIILIKLQFEEFYFNMDNLMTTASYRFMHWTNIGRDNDISWKHLKIICVTLKYVQSLIVGI